MAVLVFYDCLLPSSSMKSHHPSITTFNTIRWREQVLAHKMEAAANACAMSELKQDHAKQVCFILIGMLLCPLPVHLSHQSRTNSLTHPLVHSLPDSPTHTHTHTHTCTHTHTHAHTRTHSPISSLQMQSLQTELAQKTRAVRTRTPLLSQPRLNLLSCSWLSCLYQCPNVLLQPMSSSTSLLAQTSCTSTHCPAHARTHTHTLSPFVLPTHMRALRCAA